MTNIVIETPAKPKDDGQKLNPPPVQTIKQMPIPFTGASWGIIQVPFPMTQDDWEELEAFLKVMKGPLTGSRKQDTNKE